jgi:hypothetical protein
MSAVQQLTGFQVSVSQEILPAGHGSHGTPDPVVKRVFRFTLPEGEAQVDQTDYGHPGRMNPPYPQVIPVRLAPKTPKIVAAAQALADLL